MDMSGQILHLLIAATVCGVVFLGSWPVGQFLLGRPALILPLMGWLTGEPLVGLWLGVCLELLFMRQLPMGSSMVPEPALGGLVSLFAVHLLRLGHDGLLPVDPWEMVATSILLALPLSYLMSVPTMLQRHINTNFWHDRFVSRAEAGDTRGFSALLPLVLLQTWLLIALASLIVIPLAMLCWAGLDRLLDYAYKLRERELLILVLAAISAGGMLRLAGGFPGTNKSKSFLWTGSGAVVGAVILALLWWRIGG